MPPLVVPDDSEFRLEIGQLEPALLPAPRIIICATRCSRSGCGQALLDVQPTARRQPARRSCSGNARPEKRVTGGNTIAPFAQSRQRFRPIQSQAG